MQTKQLYLSINELLDNYPAVDMGVKIGALAMAQQRLCNMCIRADAQQQRAQQPAEAPAGEGGEVAPEQVKEAAKRKSARVSFRDDGSVGITYDKGKTWKSYKKTELPGLLSELLYA